MQSGRSSFMASRISALLIKAACSAALAAIATSAAAAPPGDTDAYVAQAMQSFGAPGLALAVVENGNIEVAKGYGVRRMGTDLAADAHTAFPIGSETKAFTAAA